MKMGVMIGQVFIAATQAMSMTFGMRILLLVLGQFSRRWSEGLGSSVPMGL